jgi:hypothetical protein
MVVLWVLYLCIMHICPRLNDFDNVVLLMVAKFDCTVNRITNDVIQGFFKPVSVHFFTYFDVKRSGVFP